MTLGLLLSLVMAAPLSVQVVVLSKYRPKAVQVLKGQCRAAAKAVDQVRLRAGTLQLCHKGRCTDVEQAVKLNCKYPAQLKIRGHSPRTYGRGLSIRPLQGYLRIIATLTEDAYVQGVVASELSGASLPAKKAQAVLARSYVRHARVETRHSDATVCDLTHCQVLREAKSAGLNERRVLLTQAGQPAPVFFHSTCGGRTRSAAQIWPGPKVHEALVSVDDTNPSTGRAWCAEGRHFQWVAEVREEALEPVLSALAGRALQADSLRLKTQDPQGLRWQIGDRHGQTSVSGRSLHRRLGRALGWSTVKSSRFSARRAGEHFLLKGRGLGHGVGMCQVGAMARAKAGQSAEQILKAYFPKLRLSR